MLVGKGVLLFQIAVLVALWSNPLFARQSSDRDCSDFASQEEAQEYFVSRGGSPTNNADLLDVDGDGIACESRSREPEGGSRMSIWFAIVGLAGLTGIGGISYFFLHHRQATRPQFRKVNAQDESTELRLSKVGDEIRSVELRLRQLIDHQLEGNTALLPQHVTKNAGERIQDAQRRNPALDSQRYTSLAGKLEYCDLRELQDIIVSKPLWPRFESRFGTKESLKTKFDQLAEVRNGISHSRSIDEIALTEGDAAILWFKKVIAKEHNLDNQVGR